MKLILAATPVLGHVNPMLLVSKFLCGLGHEVVFATGSQFRKRVVATGARFVPFMGLANPDLTDMDRAFPERKSILPGPPQLRFDFEHIFIQPIAEQYAVLQQILAGWPADVILGDSWFFGSMPFLTRSSSRRPVIAVLGVTFMTYHRDDGAPALLGLPPAHSEEQRTDYMKSAAHLNEVLFAPCQKATDTILENIGARPLPLPLMDSIVALPDVFLQTTVRTLEYPRRDMPPNVRFIGALPAPAGVAMPARLEEKLGSEQRIVLVTQGTVANHDLGQLLTPTIRAFAGDDSVLILATTGGRDTQSFPLELPTNTVVAPFLPYEKIMPHVHVLVTNGGYGTVMQAIAQGIPIVAAGKSEDKPEVNARVFWSGAGIDLRTNAPTPESIRYAVQQVSGDSTYRARSREHAMEFRKLDTLRLLLAELSHAVRERVTTH